MSVILNPKALAAAAECASEDPSRPALNGVHVDGAGWVVGTDGHVLLEVAPPASAAAMREDFPTPDGGHGEDFNGDGFTIPTANAKAAARMAPKRATHPILRYLLGIVRGKETAEIFATDLDSRKVERFRMIEAPFPRWRELKPKHKTKARVCVNVVNLLRIADALRKAGVEDTERNGGSVLIEVRGPMDAIQFSALTGDGQAVRALLMPVRDPRAEAEE